MRLRLEREDGSAILEGAPSALQVGVAASGDERYHSPSSPSPRGVSYLALEHGIEASGPSAGRIRDAEGRAARVELSTSEPGVFRLLVEMEPEVMDAALMRLLLQTDAGGYHGLGERFGRADARGTIVPMQLALGGTASGTNEHHVPIPFVVSTEGYGVFVRSREAGAFDVGATDPSALGATFEGRRLEILFFVDPDPRQVVAAYTRSTGLPRLPPRWAYAPMHWRDEWASRDEAMADAARIRAEDIPCTTFWIDNPWQVSYNDSIFDESRFPDPPGMLAELRSQGFLPLLWSTPYLDAPEAGASPTNEAERLFLEAEAAGWLVRRGAADEIYISSISPGAAGGMVDFTSPEATRFWQSRLEPLVQMGVRAFKLDYAEDVVPELLGQRTQMRFSDGSSEREMHNVYNMRYHEPYRRALDAQSPEGGFLLVRASAYGGQQIADIVWPGDLDNDLREGLDGEVGGLPAAITALQSLAASGFPNFGSDTGGYRGGMPTREALLRWAEHTAFTPILQLGGDGAHHNPWLLDAEAGAIYRRLARAHMDLVPYLRSYAIRAAETGLPPVNAPALAYPDDPGSALDPYAYLLGDDLFVAPVITPGATERSLHLPPGRWIHFFTRLPYEGSAALTVPAPLGMPPVFIRAGAILPLLPADLDTLSEGADPAIVEPADRPFLRAWIFPAERRSIETEAGIGLTAERVALGVDLDLRFAAGGLQDLRILVHLDQAIPPLGAVTELRFGGVSIPPSADRPSVEGGCDACWIQEANELRISVRAPARIEIR